MCLPRFHLTVFALLSSVLSWAAGTHGPVFTQNAGQWHEDVHFKIAVSGAYVYLDREGMTVDMLESTYFDKLHRQLHGEEDSLIGAGHVLKIRMVGADFSRPSQGDEDVGHSYNYFLGNDPSRWATDVRSFRSVTYRDVYPGIDVVYHTRRGKLKYDFRVSPGADPGAVSTSIEGGHRIFIRDGDLVVATSVGEYREVRPYAYQIDEQGREVEVPCRFRLTGDEVSFEFPEGYDETLPLVIDPEIAFSSFVGSVSDNFGFTATYDDEGNLYAGAIVFGSNYPTTAGAYQQVFGGGNIDCGITKFSSDGTQLLYSTFFGGSAAESPHSMMVNENNELYVMGSTGSSDMPVTPDALQTTFGGGTMVPGIGFQYSSGVDVFVARFSADGTELLSSTYVGGSGNDGVGTVNALNFNYGDIFRGEIVVGDDGHVYLGTVSTSWDFPVVGGFATQPVSTSSGVVCKINPDLSEMVWSTFTGGTTNNAVYGIQVAQDGSVYATGGTGLGTLPGTAQGYQPVHAGGSADGFVQRIAPDGASVMSATFAGTNAFDQIYLVQLDSEGFVYVVGQSMGSMEITDGVYSNPNGKQFIRKYTADLGDMVWGTVIGSSSGQINISPSAFLVTHCNQIYLSGWGGSVNNLGNAGGNTFGLPITPDAFQSSTDGSDFYLMVLEADATDLVYGTYFGGASSPEHVDGGTSRFDKDGTVYQAVCAGCGGNDDFPTQPGVWSQTNDASNCNLGVFKFNLSSVSAVADFDNSSAQCQGEEIQFQNLSTGADTYLWDFGDGNTSTETSPEHAYDEPGTYEITLYAEDSNGCLTDDSTTITVEIGAPPLVEVDEAPPLCVGETVQLNASGAESYTWSPSTGLSATDIPDPVFSGEETTTYTVTGTGQCGSSEATVTVTVGEIDVEVEELVKLCPGESHTFDASGGTNYLWEPGDYLDDDDVPNPTTTPDENVTYTLTVSDDAGCEGVAHVQVIVLPPPPTLTVGGPYVACNGDPVRLFVSGGGEEGYVWSPESGLDDPHVANPYANPIHSTTYTVTSENECGIGTAEVVVKVSFVDVTMSTDSVVCYDTPFEVAAQGGMNYKWRPPHLFAEPGGAVTQATITSGRYIEVIGYNADGCHDVATTFVNVHPRAVVDAGANQIVYYGESATLHPYSPYPVVWEADPDLSCTHCANPVVSTLESSWYYATVTGPEGCVEIDSVKVIVRGNIYVPNAFSPDGDGLNEIFKAKGVDIVEFRMEIYNRWGEMVFESDDINTGWNGSSPNSDYYAPPGVYPYRIVAREHGGEVYEIQGHVTLIR